MANIVFVLGAGASQPGGCPTMPDFFDRARTLHATNQLDDYAEHYDHVTRFRQLLQRSLIKTSLDINNLESIFTALEMADLLQPFHLDHVTTSAVRHSLLQLILGVLERTQRHQVQVSTNPERPLGASGASGYLELAGFAYTLLHQPPRHALGFITFNYDVCLEIALTSHQLRYSYCLTAQPSAPDVISLCKLHGSLNWLLNADQNTIATFDPTDVLVRQHLSTPGIRDSRMPLCLDIRSALRTLCGSADVSPSPLVIPPTDDKGQTRRRLSTVWRTASHLLREAEVIVVVGYSLPETDQFFRQFLALSLLGDTIIRHFIVIDVSPNSIAFKRFRACLSPSFLTQTPAVFQELPSGFLGGVKALQSLYDATARVF